MKHLVYLTLCCCLWGCVPTPTAPINSSTGLSTGGLFVVCEGLWRQDNATLSYVGLNGNSMRDVVSSVNVGQRLGDTGSDIIVRGDSVFVCVHGSRSIEVYHRITGAWITRLSFASLGEPYKLTAAANGIAYCSILSADAIAEIDLNNMSIRVPRIPTGPAPEGLCVLGTRVFIANSGLGDLRKTENGASTVSVINTTELFTERVISGLPNVMTCIADSARNVVWILYRNYPSQLDSLGGLVCWDVARAEIVNHLRYAAPKGLVIHPTTGLLYILHGMGIDQFNPETNEKMLIIAHKSGGTQDVWYSMAWWPARDALAVGNARSFVTDGEIVVVSTSGSILQRIPVGLNPSAIAPN